MTIAIALVQPACLALQASHPNRQKPVSMSHDAFLVESSKPGQSDRLRYGIIWLALRA
jgi:hypothetical protein